MILIKDSFRKVIIQALFISIIVFGFVLLDVVQSLGEDNDYSEVLCCEGSAEIMSSGSDEWIPLAGDAKIGVGDEVMTKDDGMVDIGLPDGSILKIGPKSHVAIKEMGMVEVTGLSVNKFELILGKIRAVVMPLVNVDSRFIIETENSTVGVRGTDFGVSYDPEKDMTELMCLDGEVDIVAKGMVMRGMKPRIIAKGLKAKRIKPGKTMSIITGVAPGRPKMMSDKKRELFFGPMDFKNERVIKRIERIKKIKRERKERLLKNLLNRPAVKPGTIEKNTPGNLSTPSANDGGVKSGGGNIGGGGSPGSVESNR
jgi:hypothetical protein